MKKILKPAIFCVTALVLASCQEKENPPAEDSVVISDCITELIFPFGNYESQTIKITANTSWTLVTSEQWVDVAPSSGEAGESTLTVSVEEVCETDREATVTITAGTALTTFKVVQKAPVKATSISLSAAQFRMMLGQALPMSLSVEPEGAIMETVTYKSSDEAVATVDQEGVITAVSVGTATMTASMGELTAEYDIEVTEEFMTDGKGMTYSFEQLAALPAGVVSGSDGTYTVKANISIAENDILTIKGTSAVLVDDGVSITILGELDFNAEESAEIRPSGSEATPKYLYLTENAGGSISNMKFINMPIRNYGEKPLTVSDCELTGIRQNYAAINLGSPALTTVTGCKFTDNSYPAISGGANIASPLIFKDNYLEGNSNDCRNRPHINVTVGGEGDVEIVGNTIIGPGEITMNGGIAVANMLGISGSNKVLIEGNKVSDCRYGITTNGVMNVRIIDNELVNNKWDSNPMTGGSGVSIYNSAGGQRVYMSGNLIKGHLWGITNIGDVNKGTGPSLNLGNHTTSEGDDYNPGGNIFEDNGNNGVLYDLYNNCPLTVYAQGNTWNVEVQDRESIEEVIFHKNDDEKLGEVIFMDPE